MSAWRLASAAALLALLTWPVAGRAAERCVALEGGRVWLPSGPVEGATVVIVGERVAAAAAGAAVPEGCERVDVSGRVVTPGFVEVQSQLGLIEVEMESSTDDAHAGTQETPNPSVRASFSVADAYNPRSTVIPVTRLGGVTSALSVPDGGLIAGRSAFVDLAGGSQAEAVVRRDVAMHASVGGGGDSRAWTLGRLRALLTEARDFQTHEAAWRQNRTPPLAFPPAELVALRPVLAGTMPLVLDVDRASDIEAALRLASDFGLRLVVSGGAEAWMVADALARAKVPVIVDAMLNAPERFDRIRARADNASLLWAAGVPLLLTTASTHNARTLGQVAGNAVRAGLPVEAAMRALTETPARVFGIADRGRLAAGARANVVVWSGDPFEVSSAPERIFIGGRDIPRVSRQTLLRDRYRRLERLHAPLGLPTGAAASPR
ncbi:MAG: amidohydrolase family protein [Deltaproteobacteria bacterium]|nr:amidohydrolase family protein [Deltaproteobacteria bacterium]MCB9786838.1 amidohydrolase family protein [Deltaproteobacteria bacterium]